MKNYVCVLIPAIGSHYPEILKKGDNFSKGEAAGLKYGFSCLIQYCHVTRNSHTQNAAILPFSTFNKCFPFFSYLLIFSILFSLRVLLFKCYLFYSKAHFFLYSCYLTFFQKYGLKIPSSFRRITSLNTKNFFRVVIVKIVHRGQQHSGYLSMGIVSTCVERFENDP